MNTDFCMELLAATLFDVIKWGAIIIGVAVALGVVGMFINGVLTGRRVKQGDEAKSELVEEALHAKDKDKEEASGKGESESSGDDSSGAE